MPHGNFSSSDISYQLGTTVTFTCSPGFVMEQGSGTIECIDPSNPHWNDSEPVCKGSFHSFSLYISFYHHCKCLLLDSIYLVSSDANKKANRKSLFTDAQKVYMRPHIIG